MPPSIDADQQSPIPDAPLIENGNDDEVMQLLAQVESQFDRIRSIRSQQDDTVRTLSIRAGELEEAGARLREREERIEEELARDVSRHEQESNRQLDALFIARDGYARRGRRLQEFEHRARRKRLNQTRLRRRILGLRHAVRRLLRRHDELQDAHDTIVQARESDLHTIEQQSNQLSTTVGKMREFSKILQEQTSRLEEGAAAIVEVSELRGRIRQLDEELERARSGSVETPASERPGQDVHLQRRRKRLLRCRHLLREQARRLPQVAQLEAARRRQESQLNEQQRHLDEVRRVLAASETRMIQRWAGRGGVQVTGWVVLLTTLVAAVSWWAANRFDPPTVQSHVTITAATVTGQEPDPTSLEAWRQWHMALLGSEGFPGKLARRLGERPTNASTQLEQVRDHINESLVIDDSQPGRIRFSMTGRTGSGTRDWLDSLARSLVSESKRTARSRPNPILANIEGRRVEQGRDRYAWSETTAIKDTRVRTVVMVFMCAAILCGLLMATFYAHLSRVQRLFDDTDPTDALDEGPSPSLLSETGES